MRTIIVDKKFSDDYMETKMANTFLNRGQIDTIFTESVNVYNSEGKLIILFRKNKLGKRLSDNFFDATVDFTTKMVTSNRGNTTGSDKRNVRDNPKVKSAILGFFDIWGPREKLQFRKMGVPLPLEVRETKFAADHPEKMEQAVPLVRRINQLYKQYLPSYFNKQNKKAMETHFKISDTAFTTITTNINFQTSIHKDKGDDLDGFGNLAVVELGKYSGGETCMPQYGIGVDVRQGDILFMDVHEFHANLPIKLLEPDAVRMSIVCYLRTNVWKRTRGKSQKFKQKHLRTIKNIKRGDKDKQR